MTEQYMGITIDLDRDRLFDDTGLARLKDGYMLDTETSPQHRFAYVSKAFGSDDQHAQRLYDYSSKMWLSYSTPILSFGKTARSLPISCFATKLGDSIESILDTSTETRMLAIVGGGVGLHVGLRPGDKKSSGIIPHLKTYDVDTLAFKQGTTRRGATAAYLDINHPEIIDFLEMRKPTGGDINRKCLNLHHGVNLSDDFMRRIEILSTPNNLTAEEKNEIDKFPLVNPYNGEVVEYASAKELWERLLTIRPETGEPYCWFIDEANRKLPKYQRDLGLRNNGSNLCSEISLATSTKQENAPARTFVCCLSSVNLEKYDEWKDDPLFVADIVEMLDNVISVFIEKSKEFKDLDAARYSAMRERAIGIGAMGWHALLQSKMIPFESAVAAALNVKIWAQMNQQAKAKTLQLAVDRGPCPDSDTPIEFVIKCSPDIRMRMVVSASDYVTANGVSQRAFLCQVGDTIVTDDGLTDVIESINSNNDIHVRNSHLFSIAPNASSSIILGTSPSIEPYRANIYLEKGVNGTHAHRNKYLEKLLEEKGKNTAATWSTIISDDGSVASLPFLDDYEKDVFKTAMELDQRWIIQHAADRQPYICQAQSLNLFFSPTAPIEYIHYIHLMAWQKKLKSLYYYRSDNMRKADKVGQQVERNRIEDIKELTARLSAGDESACVSCEG